MTTESATSSRTPAIPWAAMAGVIATVSVFAVAQGLTYPLLSFTLERHGTIPGLIGLSAAMTPLGFVVCAPLIPAVAGRVGTARLSILRSILAALMLIAIAWMVNIWTWMPLRFLLGLFANALYVISENWLIAIAPAARLHNGSLFVDRFRWLHHRPAVADTVARRVDAANPVRHVAAGVAAANDCTRMTATRRL